MNFFLSLKPIVRFNLTFLIDRELEEVAADGN